MQTHSIAIAACVAGLPVAAMADTFTDGVDLNHNVGGWTISGNPNIDAAGGNPGYWLHNPLADTFAPIVRTGGVASAFLGDYRAMGVTSIAFDAQLIDRDTPSGTIVFGRGRDASFGHSKEDLMADIFRD